MQTGLFHACYGISSGLAGGYALNLNLVVDTVSNKASGMAKATQGGVQGAPTYTFQVTGDVIAMTVMPNVTHYLVVLQSASMPGRHLDVRMVMASDWQSGNANVSLWLDTPNGAVQFSGPVAPTTCGNQVGLAA